MDLIRTLKNNRQYVVLGGLLVGALYVLEIIPSKIDFFGDNTKYFYVGLIALAGYVYWRFHWGRSGDSFERSMPARNLSNPQYMQSVERQRGPVARKAPVVNPPSSEQEPPTYSNDIADKFKRN